MGHAARLAARDEVVWADVEGELVLLHSGTGDYYALNETGAVLVAPPSARTARKAQARRSHGRRRRRVFEVQRPDAEWDVRALVDALREADLVVTGSGQPA